MGVEIIEVCFVIRKGKICHLPVVGDKRILERQESKIPPNYQVLEKPISERS